MAFVYVKYHCYDLFRVPENMNFIQYSPHKISRTFIELN